MVSGEKHKLMLKQSIAISISLIVLACAVGVGTYLFMEMRKGEIQSTNKAPLAADMSVVRDGLSGLNKKIDQLNSTLQAHQNRLSKLESLSVKNKTQPVKVWEELIKNPLEKSSLEDGNDAEKSHSNPARRGEEFPIELTTPEGRAERFEDIMDGYRDKIYSQGADNENVARAYEYANTDIGMTLQKEGVVINSVECNSERCLFEGDVSGHVAISTEGMGKGDDFQNEDSYNDFLNKIYEMVEEIGMSRSNTAIQRNGDRFYIYAKIKDPENQDLGNGGQR